MKSSLLSNGRELPSLGRCNLFASNELRELSMLSLIDGTAKPHNGNANVTLERWFTLLLMA